MSEGGSLHIADLKNRFPLKRSIKVAELVEVTNDVNRRDQPVPDVDRG
jgi:hypothetical protein